MRRSTRRARIASLFATTAALSLVGCGGGGGTPAPAPTPSPAPSPSLPTVDVSSVAAADPGSTLSADWQHGAFMEIFVRSYQDSDGDGNGDLKGLISRLDYLHDLGVRGIWLMPVTASEDHDHGYAVADYRAIEPDYGTLADFDQLLTQAHARGIGVIVDYVMNHSAATNPLFVNAAASAGNPYRDWYVWQPTDPGGWSVYGADPWNQAATGWYYSEFWSQMPDFDLLNATVAAYHHDNQRFWLNRGADGFRFDAVGNFVEHGPSAWLDQPEDYTLMHDVRTLMDGYSQRYLVCEGSGDPQGFGAASGCGGAFAFDLNAHVLLAANTAAPAEVQTVADYFKTAQPGMATLLANHDSFTGGRVADQLGNDPAKMRVAAATYLLLPGTPFIYYGEELGMTGAATLTGDAGIRTPMSWTADAGNAGFSTASPYRALSANSATANVQAEATDPDSLYTFYKTMLALRNGRPSVSQGSYVAAVASGATLTFQRVSGAERTLVVINYGAAAASVAVAGLPANATITPLFPAGGSAWSADSSGGAQVASAARRAQVFAVTP